MDVPFTRRSFPALALALAVLLLCSAGCGGGSASTGIKVLNSATTTVSTPNTHSITSLRIVTLPGGTFTDHSVSIAPGGSQFFQLNPGTYSVVNIVYDDGLSEAATSPNALLIFVTSGFTSNLTVSHGP